MNVPVLIAVTSVTRARSWTAVAGATTSAVTAVVGVQVIWHPPVPWLLPATLLAAVWAGVVGAAVAPSAAFGRERGDGQDSRDRHGTLPSDTTAGTRTGVLVGAPLGAVLSVAVLWPSGVGIAISAALGAGAGTIAGVVCGLAWTAASASMQTRKI